MKLDPRQEKITENYLKMMANRRKKLEEAAVNRKEQTIYGTKYVYLTVPEGTIVLGYRPDYQLIVSDPGENVLDTIEIPRGIDKIAAQQIAQRATRSLAQGATMAAIPGLVQEIIAAGRS